MKLEKNIALSENIFKNGQKLSCMIFSFIYNCFLGLLALVTAPKFLYHYYFQRKYSDSLPQKFGVNLPEIEKKGRFLIWIHAVSVGETKAISSLARVLKKEYPDCILIVSSTTETGHAEAKRCLAFSDYHIYLPLDFSWIIKPYVKRVSPDLVILCESDFWYHFLQASRESGAKIALANGKISEKSTKRLSFFPFFSKKLFSFFDLACLQSEHYKARFLRCEMPEDLIVVTGNLKLDDSYPFVETKELALWKQQLGIEIDDKVVVIGSTHPSEEELILESLRSVWLNDASLKVILVPRHPERFDEVAKILDKLQIPFKRFSASGAKEGREKVVLIDAMGLLRKCYQLADIAIVAGSYTDRVGGHNILEPCSYGIPTVFGPHMQNQPEFVKLVKKFGAGLQVDIKDLSGVIRRLLEDSDERKSIGNAGMRLIENSKGATDKTCFEVLKLKA